MSEDEQIAQLEWVNEQLRELRDQDKSTWSVETCVAAVKLAAEAVRIAAGMKLNATRDLGFVLRGLR